MEEAPNPKRDRLEDALALLHDVKEIISLHAKREDRNARSRLHMAQKRTHAPTRYPEDDEAA